LVLRGLAVLVFLGLALFVIFFVSYLSFSSVNIYTDLL